MMAYRETEYLCSEPTLAECLSFMPNHHLEGSDDSLRKLSPSGSIMSESGAFGINFKRDDCIVDSVPSLSGHSDNCSSPPMKQQLPSSGNLQVGRENSFKSRPSISNALGPVVDESPTNIYHKGQTSNIRHKNGFNQLQTAMRKFPDYSYNHSYSDASNYPGQFNSVSNYDQRTYSNSHADSMSSQMYGSQIPYQPNDYFYGTQPSHETDPTSFMPKNSINDYSSHQGHHLTPPNMFHSNHRSMSHAPPPKDTRDGLCQDFSWMRDKKSGKKVHDARRK